ncbi:uncharacterized protein BX664DRAFT_358414 [Halteromyces radiatus]|uniref:uncharacterized protein n=1 Tax=Halteromyces radiatus TaxID=101107 RepID=UPI00222003D5|nr:uncharacterized protein BX664DRAFT_358414 [Halteromyces radiatus]KAI8088771.1 hypothetical protein BX664DRAFT_358414 [Halteromyces radiatus]
MEPVLNLTEPIYPIESLNTMTTIRPPTPCTPTAFSHPYSLFEPRHDYYECSLCPPKSTVPTVISPSFFPCVKLTNIPWDVSQTDIKQFLGNLHIPSNTIYTQAIHILMDRTTGKTLSDAYVELATMEDVRYAIETKHQKPLKGRIVSVIQCQQEELLTVIFPKWRGKFSGTTAIPPDTKVVKSMSTAAGGGGNTCPPFITREEINSLLVVCKNYKLHFSRKCAERPFENIITIIAKYPWHQAHLITTLHRDQVYEMLNLAIESLMNHLTKDYVQIEPSLLERLVRAGLLCPAFTERQKMALLQVSGLECPLDLVHLLMRSDFSPCDYSSDPVYYHSPLSSRHSSLYDHFSHHHHYPLSTHLISSSPSSSSSNSSTSSSTRLSHPSLSLSNKNKARHPQLRVMVPPLGHPHNNRRLHSTYSTNQNCRKTLSPWAPSYLPMDDDKMSWPSSMTSRGVTSSGVVKTSNSSIMTI